MTIAAPLATEDDLDLSWFNVEEPAADRMGHIIVAECRPVGQSIRKGRGAQGNRAASEADGGALLASSLAQTRFEFWVLQI